MVALRGGTLRDWSEHCSLAFPDVVLGLAAVSSSDGSLGQVTAQFDPITRALLAFFFHILDLAKSQLAGLSRTDRVRVERMIPQQDGSCKHISQSGVVF